MTTTLDSERLGGTGELEIPSAKWWFTGAVIAWVYSWTVPSPDKTVHLDIPDLLYFLWIVAWIAVPVLAVGGLVAATVHLVDLEATQRRFLGISVMAVGVIGWLWLVDPGWTYQILP